MTRLFLSFLVCGSSLLATAAAPRPVSFMDGAVKYDAEGRLTSVDNISGINIFNIKYTPVMGPDTTEYSGLATLVMEGYDDAPYSVNLYLDLDSIGYVSQFYYENPDDETMNGTVSITYTPDGYVHSISPTTDFECDGVKLIFSYSAPVGGARQMTGIEKTVAQGTCYAGKFIITPSPYPDIASVNPALTAAMQTVQLGTPIQMLQFAGLLGKSPAMLPAAISFPTGNDRWLFTYEIAPTGTPYRIDCNNTLWASYGW